MTMPPRIEPLNVDGGEVVGWCDVLPVMGQTRAHVGVLGMAVAASHRGRGLGRRLIQAAMARATARGLTRIELTVHVENGVAQALYRSVGFELEGTKRHRGGLDGQYFDVHQMAWRRDTAPFASRPSLPRSEPEPEPEAEPEPEPERERECEYQAAQGGGRTVFQGVESVVLFVPDIDAAARWHAGLVGAAVEHENARYAHVRGPGVTIGFHPADEKCPGGVGGATVYWEVQDLDAAVSQRQARGAVLHRGPGVTSLGARVAMLRDPFGCTIGLNQASARSRVATRGGLPAPGPAAGGA